MHRYRSLLSFIFLVAIFFALSQNEPVSRPTLLAQYNEADHFYHLALNTQHQYSEEEEEQLNQTALEKFRLFLNTSLNSRPFDSLTFFAYVKLGELQHYFENFPEALTYYTAAIGLKKKLPLVSDSFLFKPYIFAGLIYYNQNKLDSALDCFKKAESIQDLFEQRLQESERLYNSLGGIYFQYGNYKQAQNYFQKALEVLSRTNPSYEALYINYNINLATILFKLEEYDAANSIYQQLLPKGIYRNQIYNNIGLINFYLGAPRQAIDYFKKVNYSNYLDIGLCNDIANAYYDLGKPDSVKKYLQLAVEKNQLYNPSTLSIDHGRTLKLYGDLERSLGHFSRALHFYQEAFHQFYPSFNKNALQDNPVKFSGAFSYINLFQTLLAKAEALDGMYRQTGLLSWGQQELETYKAAFRLIDYVERTYESDEARLFLERTKYIVHIRPIDIAYELYQKTKNKNFLEALYNFDQQNKASILSLNSQLREQLSFKDTSLMSKERLLKTEITRLSLKAAELKEDSSLSKINSRIRDYEIELGKVQDRISSSVSGFKIPSTEFLQTKLLDNATALISFHLSEDKLTSLLITHEKFDCLQQELPAGFRELISKYVDELKQPSATGLAPDAKQIYRFLFSKLDLKNIERLIIIPDDELNYLSFESLRDSTGQFLVEKFAVQYQYSTSLLKKENLDFSDHQTLAFAPFVSNGFKDSSINFERLYNSSGEINNLKGAKFIDSSATKANFLKELSRYKVLHLATHAVANNKKDHLSFISFYPSQKNKPSEFLLYAQEIYNLPLNKTDLVILSACETASGNLVKGEGIMSLSRAFAYAGCSNIITSLWNANDFSTAYLTNRIHFYLDKNYTIDAALRQAKLDYLKDQSVNPRLKDPFYWSHLIFIGNYDTKKSRGHWWWIALGGIVLASALIFLKRKSLAKRRPGVHHRLK